MRAAWKHIAAKFVPVEPPTRRPSRRESTRIAASETASGTRSMVSITPGTKEGSTRGLPMPSMREGRSQWQPRLRVEKPSKKAERSTSATESRVAWRL